jgi:hypothetical protein
MSDVILAVRELRERDSGMTAEGMTAAEVAARAMECWPAAFPRGTDPNELEYLLEEMEGFGIARRTVAGSFALRSRSLSPPKSRQPLDGDGRPGVQVVDLRPRDPATGK